MRQNYELALKRVLAYEGGKVDDPHDPGGRTAYGITQNTYNASRKLKGLPTQDVYKITSEEVAEIYQRDYWNRMKCDDMPSGVDLLLFDGGVNSGNVQSVKWLQRALNDGGARLGVDGQLGPQTMAAVEECSPEAVIRAMATRRLAFLQALRTWGRYGKGWTTRVNGQRDAALKLARLTTPLPAPMTKDGTGKAKARLADAKTAAHTASADSATAGGATLAGASQVINQAIEQIQPFTGLPHVENVVFYLTAAGLVIGAVGGVFSWYQRRKRDALADALGTKPAETAA